MKPLELAQVFGLDTVLQEQSQLLRRDQALVCGFTAAQVSAAVRRGRWKRVFPQVYLLGAEPPTPAQRVRAAWLWAGESAAIGGSAAAWWHGIEPAPVALIEVIVARSRRMSSQPCVRIIRSDIDPRDIVWRDGIRVTSAARTCLDLARWGRDDLLEESLRQRLTRVEKLPPSLARGWHRRGQRQAREVVAEVMANPWSRAERLAHRVLQDASITGWVANQRARSVRGAVFPDIAFEDVKLAVEIDSRRFHDRTSDAEAWERDHERELALVRAGWTVIRVTYRQLVEQPEMIVAAIKEVLERLRATARR